MSSRVSLIIPTLDAGNEILSLLQRLDRQTREIDELVVVDSSSKDCTEKIVRDYSATHRYVRFEKIPRGEFDHGLTRDRALREWTTGDFVLFMTQDAVPADDSYIEKILEPFSDPRVAVASGRQLPKADARPFERKVREFNYPKSSFVRGKSDLAQYGIKTFYTTDVCSAYRRSAYLECGGFCRTMMSEDMYMAAKFVEADYLVAYASDAKVYHSHNLTPGQQYRRNFMVGQFLEAHKDILMGANEIGEGKKLVKEVAHELLREGHPVEFVSFGIDCAARFLGNRAGRRDVHQAKEKG